MIINDHNRNNDPDEKSSLESIRGLSKEEEEGRECAGVRFVTNEWVATFFLAPRGDLLTHHEVTRNPFCCS